MMQTNDRRLTSPSTEPNELGHEIAELKGFIAELKADRALQKEKERRESWTKYTSLSLVFVAVLAAIASQWSGKYSGTVLVELNNATFHQAEASDKWSYYQAKSIKQNLYEALRDSAPKTALANNADSAQGSETFNAKIAKYKAEEATIMQEARDLEQQRTQARNAASRANARGAGMGKAVAVFQISIALSSICLVTKKRPLWYLSLALAAAATGQMLHVWLS